MARTKQTARMAAPGGPVAQLRYALQCGLHKRKRNHWADEVEPTHGAALNPRKKASGTGMEREKTPREALVDLVVEFFRQPCSGAAKWNSFFGRHCDGPWNAEVVYFDQKAAEADSLDAHAWRSLVDGAPDATAAWLRHGMRFEEYASPMERAVIVLTFAAVSKPRWHELVRAELEAVRPMKDETDDFDEWESNQEYLDHDTGYDTCLADWQASPSALIALLTRITDDYVDM